MTPAPGCASGRRTSAVSSWRQPTSASGRCGCRTLPTARSTSSICIAASSSSAPTSPSTCAITSSNTNSRSPRRYGRIYRVVHETTKRDTTTGAGGRLTTTQLVDLLSHPNGWWRETAQRLLIERGDRTATAALSKLAATAKEPRTRLHALWTLDGLDALQPDAVIKAMDDSSRDVRMSAVRIVGTMAWPNRTVRCRRRC